ncbi:MAG: protein kinase [Pyrinomonadaceae bacterium]|nr:protein kinase [Pyrinomonadaceae bacterium]
MLTKNQILQGRYRITRQLGAGGMGAVYEAIDERFGEPIALKEIIFDSVNEKQREILSKAFEREAKSLAKSKHDAVPYVRDYFSEIDRQFLVMELVEGEDLAGMLDNRGKPFPLEDVLNWMDQLLDALDYLHNLKPPIIHRDIKPQNLKLNIRRRIKLLDFGIARSSDKSSSTFTKQTFVGATLNYSPIEQLLRVIDPTFREFILLKYQEKAEAVLSQDTDARCDIYALGGTFYHLLTNVAPIDATKRILEIWEGKTDPLPNPKTLNPLIPSSVSNCLLKAMSIEQNQRFSTALEMQKALKVAINEAKTENLETTDLSQAETVAENNLKIEAPTEVLPIQPLKTQFSKRENFSATYSTGSISNPEFTAPSYLNAEQQAVTEVLPIKLGLLNEPLEPKRKTGWLLPSIFIGILAISGILVVIWLAIPTTNSTVSNKSFTNQTVPTPTSTATPITNAAITPLPTQSKPEPTKPTVAPTINKKIVNTPTKTPTIRKTPNPQKDPNCVFTNSCG